MTESPAQSAPSPQLVIFDTAASSKNLGDQIIMDAVRRQLRSIAPEAFHVTVPTHDFIGSEGRKLIEQSTACVVGGTNLLSSEINKYNQWKVSWRDTLWLRNVILLGVGWWQYQGRPNIQTRMFLRRVLHRTFSHSLRDGYTLAQLGAAGLHNAINTSCVTLWEMDATKQAAIPQRKAASVVATLTDYKPAPKYDKALLEMLQRSYEKVYVWIQGSRDYRYLSELGVAGVEPVDPHLDAYDEILTSNVDLDYVGTRLHAGVRAMTRGRRSIIIGVDNRAVEIAKNTDLPMIPRDDGVEAVASRIGSTFATNMTLPWDAIQQWKDALRGELGLPQRITSGIQETNPKRWPPPAY